MKIIRNFSKKYAILFALLVTVAFRCCMKLKGLLILPLLPDSLALSGALFGAIYLRVGFFTSSFLVTETTGIQEINNINFESLIAIPITLLIAIFLLRKSKRQELFDRIKEQRNRLGW